MEFVPGVSGPESYAPAEEEECEPIEEPSLGYFPSWSWAYGEAILEGVAACLGAAGLPVPRLYMGAEPPVVAECCEWITGWWGDVRVGDGAACPPQVVNREFNVRVIRCKSATGELFVLPGGEDPRPVAIGRNSLVVADVEAILCCDWSGCIVGSCGRDAVRLLRARHVDGQPCHFTDIVFSVLWSCGSGAPPMPRLDSSGGLFVNPVVV